MEAYWSYTENIIIQSNVKSEQKLWSFIKHKKVSSAGITSLKVNGILKGTSKEKAELFNSFSSIFLLRIAP